MELKTFVFTGKYGVSVIRATNNKEALELLKKKEGDSPYLSHGAVPENFFCMDGLPAGVQAYMAS